MLDQSAEHVCDSLVGFTELFLESHELDGEGR